MIKELKITIICNLHQIDLATKYSDRIIGLLDGQINFNEVSSKVNKQMLQNIYN